MVRKQPRPKRAPVSCERETGQEDNCGSDKGGDKPLEGKVLEDMSNGIETVEGKVNGVSEIGDENGNKVEKSEGEGEGGGGQGRNQKESLNLESKKEEENGERESKKRVKFDDNVEFIGGDGVSEEKIVIDEDSTSLRKRLRGYGRKKVNYNDYVLGLEIDEALFGERKKKRRGGQKGKKSKTDEVQVTDASKEGNGGENSKKKRGRKSRKDENVKESDGFKPDGGEGEVNKVRRRGPEKQEKEVKKERAGFLDCVEQEKVASQRDEWPPYSLRSKLEEHHVLNDSKKKVNDIKVKNFFSL